MNVLDFSFKLKVYPNPMRDDGVFVAEDRPIEPYKSRGLDGKLYPALPETKFFINSELEPSFAHELVRRWNAYRGDA